MKLIIPILGLVVFTMSVCVWAQDCPADTGTREDAAAFLRSVETQRSENASCIEKSIFKIGRSRSERYIDILIRYLDYRRLPNASDQPGASFRFPGPSDTFPAIEGLISIGTPALPALAETISSRVESELTRENALRTVMLIHRSNPPGGISYLLNEAKRTDDPAKGELLRQAANAAVKLCGAEFQPHCAAANAHE